MLQLYFYFYFYFYLSLTHVQAHDANLVLLLPHLLQGVRLQNIDYDAAKRIIYMLTYFFPERLGICLLVGAPLFFSAAWHIIKPWLHARTQSKILFVQPSQLGSHIAPESLPDWLGGTADDECPSNEYSQP